MIRTGQNWSELVRTGHDMSGQVNIGHDRPKQANIGHNILGWVRMCQEGNRAGQGGSAQTRTCKKNQNILNKHRFKNFV